MTNYDDQSLKLLNDEHSLYGTNSVHVEINGSPNELKGKSSRLFLPQRYVISFLMFIALLICYILRVNLSVTILPLGDEHHWNSSTRGIALAAFFWGYIWTQLPGGLLSKRFGGKIVFSIAVLGAAFFTALLPFVAFDFRLFVACRILTGIFEGATYPTVQTIIGQWVPDKERSTLLSFIYSGAFLGTIVSNIVCPYLIAAMGWQGVFYASALVAFLWYIIWQIIGANCPEESRFISEEELLFIKQSRPPVIETTVVPVKFFLSKMPVWAFIVHNFCVNWGFYTLLMWLPSYMKDELHFDLEAAGFLSFLPYVLLFLISIVAGPVSDFMIRSNVDRTLVRKIFQNLGMFVPSIFLALLCFHPRQEYAVILVVLAIGTSGIGTSVPTIVLDMAPNHAGIIIGLSNTAGTIPGMVSVIVTGFILNFLHSWSAVFLITVGINIFGAIFFSIFATSKRIL